MSRLVSWLGVFMGVSQYDSGYISALSYLS